MKQEFHRQSIRLEHYDYSSNGAYFVTICLEGRLCLLGNNQAQPNIAGEMIRAELEKLPERFPHLKIDAIAIMPNHIHVIFFLDGSDTKNDITIGRGEPCVRPSLDIEATIQTQDSPTDVQTKLEFQAKKTIVSKQLSKWESRPVGEHKVRPYDVGEHKVRPYDDFTLDLRQISEYQHPTGTHEKTIGRIVQAFKSLTTVLYIKGVRELGWEAFEKRFWQRNYFDVILRDEAHLEKTRDYIIRNPDCWFEDVLNSEAL